MSNSFPICQVWTCRLKNVERHPGAGNRCACGVWKAWVWDLVWIKEICRTAVGLRRISWPLMGVSLWSPCTSLSWKALCRFAIGCWRAVACLANCTILPCKQHLSPFGRRQYWMFNQHLGPLTQEALVYHIHSGLQRDATKKAKGREFLHWQEIALFSKLEHNYRTISYGKVPVNYSDDQSMIRYDLKCQVLVHSRGCSTCYLSNYLFDKIIWPSY